ncbi:unnamed protein product [Rotaria sordida]|uniref:Uncharacterized protein n=1 Tax=Rotaria sordida TaxID=392033 RepID=A0A819T708_9BILA|nr:unnamed protein product [Rotaria sordida]CAF1028267.1 unnamed protein product [Rotaria sordida]CAF3717221.1 unnamed protein product [Rotaria sordida]CAF4074865.1 unnamed protein product [Rotaria sordida]
MLLIAVVTNSNSQVYEQEIFTNLSSLNQVYYLEFGYAPVDPVGSLPSVPKAHLHLSRSSHHRHQKRH